MPRRRKKGNRPSPKTATTDDTTTKSGEGDLQPNQATETQTQEPQKLPQEAAADSVAAAPTEGGSRKTKKRKKKRAKRGEQAGTTTTKLQESSGIAAETASASTNTARPPPRKPKHQKLSADDLQRIKAPKLTHWLPQQSQSEEKREGNLFELHKEHQQEEDTSASLIETLRELLQDTYKLPYSYDSREDTLEELNILYQGSHRNIATFCRCVESGHFDLSFYCCKYRQCVFVCISLRNLHSNSLPFAAALFTEQGFKLLQQFTAEPTMAYRSMWRGLLRNIGDIASKELPVVQLQTAALLPALSTLASIGEIPRYMTNYMARLAEDVCFSWGIQRGEHNFLDGEVLNQMSTSKFGRVALLTAHAHEIRMAPPDYDHDFAEDIWFSSFWEQRTLLQTAAKSYDDHPYLYKYLSRIGGYMETALLQHYGVPENNQFTAHLITSPHMRVDEGVKNEMDIEPSLQTPHKTQLLSSSLCVSLIEGKIQRLFDQLSNFAPLGKWIERVRRICIRTSQEINVLTHSTAAQKLGPPQATTGNSTLERIVSAKSPSRQSFLSSYLQSKGLIFSRYCWDTYLCWTKLQSKTAVTLPDSGLNKLLDILLTENLESHKRLVQTLEEIYERVSTSTYFSRQSVEYVKLCLSCHSPLLPTLSKEAIAHHSADIFLLRARQIFIHLYSWSIQEWKKCVADESNNEEEKAINSGFSRHTEELLHNWYAFERMHGDSNTLYQVTNFLENVGYGNMGNDDFSHSSDEELAANQDNSQVMLPTLSDFDQYIDSVPGITCPIPSAIPEPPQVKKMEEPEYELNGEQYELASLDMNTRCFDMEVSNIELSTQPFMGVGSALQMTAKNEFSQRGGHNISKQVKEVLGKKKKDWLRQRPDYFLGVRVPSFQLWKDAEKIQRKIVEQHPELSSCVVPVSEMHFSLVILSLPDQMSVENAKYLFQLVDTYIYKLFSEEGIEDSSPHIDVEGLDAFPGSRVLFAKPNTNITLSRLCKVAEFLYMLFSVVGYTSDYCVLFDRLNLSRELKRRLNVDNPTTAELGFPEGMEKCVRPLSAVKTETIDFLHNSILNMASRMDGGINYEDIIEKTLNYVLPNHDLDKLKQRHTRMTEELNSLFGLGVETDYLRLCSNSNWQPHLTLLKLSRYHPRKKAQFLFFSEKSARSKKRPKSIPPSAWQQDKESFTGNASIFRIEMNRMRRNVGDESEDGYYRSISHIYLPRSDEESFSLHLTKLWEAIKNKHDEDVGESSEHHDKEPEAKDDADIR